MAKVKPSKIEKLVPESYRQFLFNLTDCTSFEWGWYNYSSYAETDKIGQLVHLLFSDNQVLSKHYESFKSLLYFFEDRTGIKVKNIIRLKVNLKPQTNIYSEDDINASIHKDDMREDNNYISIVYYINDSDGETIIYDEDKKTIIESMTPISGGCIYFNSNYWHRASPPKETNKRLVVNMVVQI